MFIWLAISTASTNSSIPRVTPGYFTPFMLLYTWITTILFFLPNCFAICFSFPFESVTYNTLILNLRGNVYSSMILWTEMSEIWIAALFIVSCHKIIGSRLELLSKTEAKYEKTWKNILYSVSDEHRLSHSSCSSSLRSSSSCRGVLPWEGVGVNENASWYSKSISPALFLNTSEERGCKETMKCYKKN